MLLPGSQHCLPGSLPSVKEQRWLPRSSISCLRSTVATPTARNSTSCGQQFACQEICILPQPALPARNISIQRWLPTLPVRDQSTPTAENPSSYRQPTEQPTFLLEKNIVCRVCYLLPMISDAFRKAYVLTMPKAAYWIINPYCRGTNAEVLHAING